MSETKNIAFLNLVARQFGSTRSDEIFDEFRSKHEEELDDSDFDLFLWSLAHRFKVDTEELLRRLGERWVVEMSQTEDWFDQSGGNTNHALDWLVSGSGLLAAAPLMGIDSFRVTVLRRSEAELRAHCLGARRCCSFLEGVARGLAALRGESVRYVREPENARTLVLSFRLFPKERADA